MLKKIHTVKQVNKDEDVHDGVVCVSVHEQKRVGVISVYLWNKLLRPNTGEKERSKDRERQRKREVQRKQNRPGLNKISEVQDHQIHDDDKTCFMHIFI